MKADSILMHKSKNCIAVRAASGDATVVQVFDMGAQKKLKEAQVPDSVVFWRWISEDVLALVGKSAVYHINITDSNAPQKMFDRVSQMAQC